MRQAILAALVLVMLGMIYVTMAFRESSIDLRASVETLALRRGPLATARTTWLSGGLTMTVETPRLDGESDSAWAARHQASVNAFLVKFPKD